MTTPGIVTATRIPAAAGPVTRAADWATPSSAFASLSRAGGAMSGVSAVSDGAKNASPVPSRPSSSTNSQMGGAEVSSAAASAACTANRTRSAASMTGRRPRRSATTPPPSMNATCGTTPAAKT